MFLLSNSPFINLLPLVEKAFALGQRQNPEVKAVRMFTFTLVPHNNQKISKTGEAESEIRIILIYK